MSRLVTRVSKRYILETLHAHKEIDEQELVHGDTRNERKTFEATLRWLLSKGYAKRQGSTILVTRTGIMTLTLWRAGKS